MGHRACKTILLGLSLLPGCQGSTELAETGSRTPGSDRNASAYESEDAPVFHRDIAPLVFEQCSICHRPGQSAPFSLLTYADVADRAEQIVDVLRSRFMPPWLPERSANRFVGERRLTSAQIELFEKWTATDCLEGDPADGPEPPKFKDGWQLGTPDSVVRLSTGYSLPPDGKDIYRNFVLSPGLQETKWIKSVEIRPGNYRAVHHALLLVDRTDSSRSLDDEDPEPGYPGMDAQWAQSPGPQFLSWQPGRVASVGRDELAWPLEPGTDLVLQVHMQPTGKLESVQPEIGLHFADQPSTGHVFKVCLRSFDIDIPAGEANYEIASEFKLPVDVELLAVLPHAHYLGRKLLGFCQSARWKRAFLDYDQ